MLIYTFRCGKRERKWEGREGGGREGGKEGGTEGMKRSRNTDSSRIEGRKWDRHGT